MNQNQNQDKKIKSARFKEAEWVASNIQQEISKVEQIIRSQAFFTDDSLVDYLIPYFREKAGGKPVRAYFSWKCFEYLAYYKAGRLSENIPALDPNQIFSTKLPLVFELAMTIQYLHNQILDEKMDARPSNRQKVNKNLIESNLLREVLFTYVKEEIFPHIGTAKNKLLKDRLRKLMMYVDLGQRLEKEFGAYDRWKQDDLPSFHPEKWLGDDQCRSLMTHYIDGVLGELKFGHAFTKVYFHRIYWTAVYFFRAIADVVAELMDFSNSPLLSGVQVFTVYYGFLAQIVNDCIDFTYTDDPKERARLKATSKKNTDFMADLFNFNITLPLVYHLQSGNRGKIESYLEGGRKAKKLLTIYPKQIMQEIVGSGAILKSISLTLELGKAATAYLDPCNPATLYLGNMCEITNDNKYLRILFNQDKQNHDNDRNR